MDTGKVVVGLRQGRIEFRRTCQDFARFVELLEIQQNGADIIPYVGIVRIESEDVPEGFHGVLEQTLLRQVPGQNDLGRPQFRSFFEEFPEAFPRLFATALERHKTPEVVA